MANLVSDDWGGTAAHLLRVYGRSGVRFVTIGRAA